MWDQVSTEIMRLFFHEYLQATGHGGGTVWFEWDGDDRFRILWTSDQTPLLCNIDLERWQRRAETIFEARDLLLAEVEEKIFAPMLEAIKRDHQGEQQIERRSDSTANADKLVKKTHRVENISDRTRRLLLNGLRTVDADGRYVPIVTVDDLIGFNASDLLRIKGFGRKALAELTEEAARHGIAQDVDGVFRRYFEENTTKTCPRCGYLISLKL